MMTIDEKLDFLIDNVGITNGRLDRLEVAIEERFDKVDERFEQIDAKFEQIDERFEQIDEKFKEIEERLEDINDRIEKYEISIKSIQLTLENEIVRNINFVAEGHQDLTRKLDDALTVENEKEMMFIRVNHLDNEVRLIKEKLAVV